MEFDTSMPLYYQVVIAIKKQIESGQLSPGNKLPSEGKLSEIYDVSRVTVRKALDDLAGTGLIERVPNRGHYVSRIVEENGPVKSRSLHDGLKRAGIKPSSVVLSMVTEPADKELADRFGCAFGEPIIIIHRIRYANDLPFAEERLYLPEFRFKGLNPWALEHESFVHIMREEYNINIDSSTQTLEARLPTKIQAEHLNIQTNKPQLFISSDIMDKDGQVVKHTKMLFVSSVVEYSFTWQL